MCPHHNVLPGALCYNKLRRSQAKKCDLSLERLFFHVYQLLTSTISQVTVESVPRVTAACPTACSVGTPLLTASVAAQALIDIWMRNWALDTITQKSIVDGS